MIKKIHFVYLKNYSSLLKEQYFWKSLLNTFLFIITSGTLQIILAIFAAFFVRGKMVKILSIVILIPWGVSEISAAIVWRLILTDRTGGLNHLLSIVGIQSQLWLVRPALAFLSLSIAQAWRYFPLIYLILITGRYSIPKELLDISRIDCITERSLIFRVYIPVMKKIILVCLLLILLRNFRAFTIIFALTGGGPLRATEVVTMFIYREAFTYNSIAKASSASIILLLLYSFAVFLYLRIKQGKTFDW